MDMRLALYALSARHNLSAQETMRLAELARLQSPIGLPARQLVQGVALLAAALGGFGVIVWLAANWDILGRFARFALLEGAIVAMSVGAFLLSSWRTPLGLGALLCTDGLCAAMLLRWCKEPQLVSGRMDGHTVGVVANQPLLLGGCW
jgi:uncharacterized membrane protein